VSREQSANGHEAFGNVNSRIVGLLGVAEDVLQRIPGHPIAKAARAIADDLEKYLEGISGLATTDFGITESDRSATPADQYVATLSLAKKHVGNAFDDGDFDFAVLAYDLKQEIQDLIEEAADFG
jgi:hypothetical protein